MRYKVKPQDKEYVKLIDGFPKDVTYRHLSNGLFMLSIPIIGNIIAFILARECRTDKKETSK